MTTFREQAMARVAPLLAPIAGANPAGDDPAGDEGFLRIKAEIDKLSAVQAREPSWRDVRQAAAELLAARAKDFRVAGWKGAADFKLDGWVGLSDALLTIDGLSRAFWDSMYPEARRARARANSFSWLVDVFARQVQSLSVAVADAEAIRTSEQVLQDLDALLADKLGDLYGGAGPLRSALREKLAALATVEPAAAVAAASAPASAPAPAPAPAPASAPAPAPAPAPASVEDAESAVRENARALLQAAGALRTADPSRAWAYRVQRWAAWLTVHDAPPSEGGRTRIRPPPDALGRRLAALRDAQRWLELLQGAEEATGSYLYWLDLHRLVATAMDRLGPGYAPAREVVGREVTAFVGRLPAVGSLAFADGTPFADPATLGWLDEEGKRWQPRSAPSAAAALQAEAEAEGDGDGLSAAQALLAEGKVADALGMAAAFAARGADGRTRFRAALATAKMALDASRPDVARPILERLAGEADAKGLDEWEPALCSTLYSWLLTAIRETMRAKNPPPELAHKGQSTFEKLCRIDPAAALKFTAG